MNELLDSLTSECAYTHMEEHTNTHSSRKIYRVQREWDKTLAKYIVAKNNSIKNWAKIKIGIPPEKHER